MRILENSSVYDFESDLPLASSVSSNESSNDDEGENEMGLAMEFANG